MFVVPVVELCLSAVSLPDFLEEGLWLLAILHSNLEPTHNKKYLDTPRLLSVAHLLTQLVLGEINLCWLFIHSKSAESVFM